MLIKNGKEIKDLYINNKVISKAYINNKLVYKKKYDFTYDKKNAGWDEGYWKEN